MTKIINIEDAAHYEALAEGEKTFLLTENGNKVKAGDTIILQNGENETTLICAAVETPDETKGLKKDWQVISLKRNYVATATPVKPMEV